MPEDLELHQVPAERVVVDDAVVAESWASHFGVSIERLRDAVLAVGAMPNAVAYFLQQSGQARVGRMKPRPDQPRVREKRRSKSRTGAS